MSGRWSWLLPLVPSLLLLLAAPLLPQAPLQGALLAAGVFALLLSLATGALLHLMAGHGVQLLLLGMVGGMLLRLLLLCGFCLLLTRFPQLHLLTACLAAAAAVVAALVIDSVQVAQRLSASSQSLPSAGASQTPNSEIAGV